MFMLTPQQQHLEMFELWCKWHYLARAAAISDATANLLEDLLSLNARKQQ